MFHLKKNPFLIDSKDIVLEKKLGQGGFGEVYKATWQGEIVAVKQILDDQELSLEAKKEFEKKNKVGKQ